MRIVGADIKSSASLSVEIDATFLVETDVCSISSYIARLVRNAEEVKLVPKNTICYKPGFEPISVVPTPTKIFRCGDATTVIWKDGTKTTVKLMKGADDSDYGAFTAALAKKIYGGNGKVMKYAGMVQRVKSKAEKKATRKLKRKYEEKITGEKKYIVSQYGQVAECKGIETDSMGVGEKVIVFAETEDIARHKAVDVFRRSSLLKEFLVLSNGSVTDACPFTNTCFGCWEKSLSDTYLYKTRVFAESMEKAKKVLAVIPAPITF